MRFRTAPAIYNLPGRLYEKQNFASLINQKRNFIMYESGKVFRKEIYNITISVGILKKVSSDLLFGL